MKPYVYVGLQLKAGPNILNAQNDHGDILKLPVLCDEESKLNIS